MAIDFGERPFPEDVWQLVKQLPVTGRQARRMAEALPERQFCVLYGIAEGLCTKEIAAYMGISVKTVEYYRQKIYEALNLDSPVMLTRFAIRAGMIEP